MIFSCFAVNCCRICNMARSLKSLKKNDMKILYSLVFILCFSAFAKAQDSTLVKVISPKIAVKLMLGKKIIFAATEISFEAVLEDSRCPKDATCIWAGQAKVKVSMKSQGSPLDVREVIFSPGLHGSILLAKTKDRRIVVENLHPYPRSSKEEGAKKEYFLSLRELPLEKEGATTDSKKGF